MPMQITAVEATQLAYRRWGVTLHLTGPSELHGPCPICHLATRDGFWVSLLPEYNGRYQCRKCGAKGWLDDDQPYDQAPDAIAEWARRKKEKEDEDARVLSAWQAGFQAGSLDAYHELLSRPSSIREWLIAEGVHEDSIERYQFGFNPQKKISDGSRFPAYVFPILDPWSGHVVNINFRLVNAPPEYGKYRFVRGIPQASFYANTHLDGPVFVTEGTKKGVVVNQAQEEANGGRAIVAVVAWPSNTPSVRLLKELENFEGGVILCLDPGSEQALARLKREFEGTSLKDKVKVLTLPVKVDDAIVRYGATWGDLQNQIKYQARPL